MKWLVACFIGLLVVVLALRHHNRSLRILIVVPDGYRGVFVIQQTESAEAKVARSEKFDAIFRVPPNGVLSVNDATAFAHWHSLEGEYGGGQKIGNPSDATGDADHASTVRLYEMWGEAEGKTYFLVGTAEDYEKSRELKRPEELEEREQATSESERNKGRGP